MDCPVCKNKIPFGAVCSVCGYDQSTDAELYPTLLPVDVKTYYTVSARTVLYLKSQEPKKEPESPKKEPVSSQESPVPPPPPPNTPLTAGALLKMDGEALYHAAATGNVKAQCLLGVRYLYGDGMPLNASYAVQCFRSAAECGYAKAQCNLARCYLYGIGVQKDQVEAIKWYMRAAQQGDATGQFAMGVLCEQGLVTGHAGSWYKKAARTPSRQAALPYLKILIHEQPTKSKK